MNILVRFFVFHLILLPGFIFSQNLIPNPSFEQFTSCPDSPGDLPAYWIDPNGSSSDYYSVCATDPSVDVPSNISGFQHPSSGFAYMGFAVYLEHEYIAAELIETLSAGILYNLCFKVSNSDVTRVGADGIGAYFSATFVTCTPPSSCVLPFTPQVSNPTGNVITDTLNWTTVYGTFTAQGNEKFITLGNFKTDSQTQTAVTNAGSPYDAAYLFIDDIILIPDSLVTNRSTLPDKSIIEIEFAGNILNVRSGQLNSLLRISDVTGNVIHTKEFSYQAQVALNTLPTGFYFAQVSDSYNRLTKKVLVIH